MSAASADRAPDNAPSSPPVAPLGWVIGAPDGDGGNSDATRIWGLSPVERLERSLLRAGCRDVRIVDPRLPPRADRSVLMLRADVILDERLVEGLFAADDTLLVCSTLGPVGAHVAGDRAAATAAALAAGEVPDASLRRSAPEQLAPAYIAKLRKREPPYVLAARPELATEVEARTFQASYKGLTDLVTKWVWPRPAAAATLWCAQRRIHPNTLTLWSWVLAIAAVWLFYAGHFATGLLAAWAMTFLDTVDGKLARVTLTSSRLGDVLDHGLDLIHPPFWWLAWGLGLGAGHEVAIAIVVGGYLVGRLLEGIFLAVFGFETHSWRPIDGMFRTITARRNPNLILLTAGVAVGRADLGFTLVAMWTVVSLAFHTLRLAQAGLARRAGDPVVPLAS